MTLDLTPRHFVRIVSEQWLKIFSVTALFAGIGYGLTLALPPIYEAHSEFTMNVKHIPAAAGGFANVHGVDAGSAYSETYNTLLHEWCSEQVLAEVVRECRNRNEFRDVADGDIVDALSDSRLELVPHSHLLTITVRADRAKLAADIANAYVYTIEAHSVRVGRQRAMESVAGLEQSVAKQKAEVARLNENLMRYHKLGNVETLKTDLATRESQLADLGEQVRIAELEDRSLFEWVKVLREVKREPEKFGVLSFKVPRAAEIKGDYESFRLAEQRHENLLAAYKEKHPAVKVAKRELAVARSRFVAAARRALQTGAAMLRDNHTKLLACQKRYAECENGVAELRQRVVMVGDGVTRISNDLATANRLLEQLMLTYEHARSAAEMRVESIALGLPAEPPEDPYFPDPFIFTGVASLIGIVVGFLLAAYADSQDDIIKSPEMLENFLGLEVLSVFPQQKGRQRRDLARSPELDRLDDFAEAAAALRNQLDTPRFDNCSRRVVILSTQPGEGKTSASTALAIASAQVQRRTLLVDCDMRRPQQETIWGFKLTRENSFSHFMQRSLSEGVTPPFSKLVNKTSVPGLDVVASMYPTEIHPASVFGACALREFFIWARANYDRVIIDSPPWGFVGDAVTLAMLADSVILLCRVGKSHLSYLAACASQLSEAGARVLGTVVNGVTRVEAASFIPGQHHESAEGMDRRDLLEHTRAFVDDE